MKATLADLGPSVRYDKATMTSTIGCCVGWEWEHSALKSNFCKLLELYETSAAKKLIFGLLVNTEKANSRRYDVTR